MWRFVERLQYMPIDYINSILNDLEILSMLTSFYKEALRFLGVPEKEWAIVEDVNYFNEKHKASIIYIDYTESTILVNLSIIQMFVRIHPNNIGDAPSVYRCHGYKLARIWQQYLKTGTQVVYELDKDSFDFATSLCIIKGLPHIDYLGESNVIKALGFNPFDKDAGIVMLRKEFGIDCCIKNAIDSITHRQAKIVTLTDEDNRRRGMELMKLRDECNKLPLLEINEGDLGSGSNPFNNVDEATAYILKIEQERLQSDRYRQRIGNEQFFFDFEHGIFRIPWASANVSYYPLEGANYPSFVVNQLSQRPDKPNQMPRYSIKPSLVHNKFLFRGQSEFFNPCVPSMFRDDKKVKKRQFADDVIQMNELEVLLRQHPLVKLFEQGFYLLHEFIQFRVDYSGLSQHYYNRTNLLDLTSDMNVAKFFAVTWFNMKEDRYERYTGTKLGVLYYYDLAADAFTFRDDRNYFVETIGKQPFMRSGNQSGFLTRVELGKNFNERPEVGYVFFRHNKDITNRIFAESEDGDKYMPQELLRTHWYKRMNDENELRKVSIEALKLNFANNPQSSHHKIVRDLQKKGFKINSKNKQIFTEDELDSYYSGALEFWEDFCSNVYFYSPEGELLRKHLMNLPNDKRYRWAFVR